MNGSIDFDNLHSENSYDAMREYCQSKLANIFFSLELQRRITKAGDNVLSVAAQPGANKTELARHMSEESYDAAVQRIGELLATLKKRGMTILLVEQNFRFAARIADRFYLMDHGKVVEGFPVGQLSAHTDKLHEVLGV